MSSISNHIQMCVLLLLGSILICSCSNSNTLRYSANLHTRRLIDRYGVLDSSRTHPYLQQLAIRLGEVHTAQSFPEIIILDASDSFAFSGTPPSILVSQGLLSLLDNEHELAFVVAHEFAHTALQHNKRLEDASNPETIDLKALELEADQYAAEMLSRAGYQGDTIPMLLVRAHDALHSTQATASHPELSLRIARVQEAFPKRPTTTAYPTREFTQFIQSLSHSTAVTR